MQVPSKMRLVSLYGMLRRWGALGKIMVFMSCCESVSFHARLFSRLYEKWELPAPVYGLHGSVEHKDRASIFSSFKCVGFKEVRELFFKQGESSGNDCRIPQECGAWNTDLYGRRRTGPRLSQFESDYPV